MPNHSLKLLFLLTAFSIAPASADSKAPTRASAINDEGVACPHERARLAAERAAAKHESSSITLTDLAPVDGPLLGRGLGFLNP